MSAPPCGQFWSRRTRHDAAQWHRAWDSTPLFATLNYTPQFAQTVKGRVLTLHPVRPGRIAGREMRRFASREQVDTQ